jgi:putative oxidoreductase
MNKFLSTQYSETSFNVASLILRLTFGSLLFINHGLDKIRHFGSMEYVFFDPFHIGHRISLVLAVIAEVCCSLLLVLGVFTRVAALILVIEFAVAAFLFHKGQSLTAHEAALLYLTAFFSLLLTGPGRISVDGMMGR